MSDQSLEEFRNFEVLEFLQQKLFRWFPINKGLGKIALQKAYAPKVVSYKWFFQRRIGRIGLTCVGGGLVELGGLVLFALRELQSK